MRESAYPATSEERFLLQVLRGKPAIGHVPSDVSRENLLHLARVQGVLAPLFQNITQHPEGWSETQCAEAANGLRYFLSRNLRLIALLQQIADAFQQDGLPWITMKGPVFTEHYYGDMTLRPSSDLDILVRPSDVAAADRAFRRIGIETGISPRPTHRLFGVLPHEHRYYSGTPRFLVELHWQPSSECYLTADSAAAIARRRTIALSTGQWPVFAPEDTLLYTTMHGFGHRWERLSHLLNIARILEKDGNLLDWPRVLATARSRQKERILRLALSLTHTLFGTPLPVTAFQHGESIRIQRFLEREALRNMTISGTVPSRVRAFALKWLGLQSAHDRFSLILRTLMVLRERPAKPPSIHPSCLIDKPTQSP